MAVIFSYALVKKSAVTKVILLHVNEVFKKKNKNKQTNKKNNNLDYFKFVTNFVL